MLWLNPSSVEPASIFSCFSCLFCTDCSAQNISEFLVKPTLHTFFYSTRYLIDSSIKNTRQLSFHALCVNSDFFNNSNHCLKKTFLLSVCPKFILVTPRTNTVFFAGLAPLFLSPVVFLSLSTTVLSLVV